MSTPRAVDSVRTTPLPESRRGLRLAYAGAVAVGAALATGELLAGLVPGVPSPLLAVARYIVDIQPRAPRTSSSASSALPTSAFQVFILLIALGVGAVIGRLAPQRPAAAATVIALFAGAGFAASLRDPSVGVAVTAAAAGIEAAVGIWVLRRLVAVAVGPEPGSPARKAPRAGSGAMPDWTRRSLLQTGGAIAIGSVVVGSVGRWLLERQRRRHPGRRPGGPGPRGGSPPAPTSRRRTSRGPA